MIACAEVRKDALGLVASGPEATARAEAFAHAAACPACAAALREATAILSLVDAGSALPPPSDDALLRASAPILATLSADGARIGQAVPPRRGVRRTLEAAIGPAVVLAAWGIAVGVARHRAAGEAPFVASLSAAAVAVALAAASRSYARLSLLATVAVSLALALAPVVLGRLLPVVAATAGGGLAGGGGALALEAALGGKCAVFELVCAALPFAAVALEMRRGRRTPEAASAASPTDGGAPAATPTLHLAAVAAAGALAGQAALHLTCEAHDAALHLLVFHAGALLVATLAAALAARLPALRPHAAR